MTTSRLEIGTWWRAARGNAPPSVVDAIVTATLIFLGACGDAPASDARRSSGTNASATPAGESVPVRQSFHMEVLSAPSPVTVAGTRQLRYELLLVNFAEEPLLMEHVAVMDAGDGTELASLEPDSLDRSLGRPGADASAAPRLFQPGGVGVLYLEIPLQGEAPTILEHRVRYRGTRGSSGAAALVRGAPTPVRSDEPVLLSPPVRGGPWVAVYHPSWERGHRRVVYAVGGRGRIPGRFAVDWFRVDSSGRHAAPSEDAVADWHGHGADVLAVAHGRVAAVRTDMPESPTRSGHASPPLADATGNYVALDIGGGRYAFYEHLQPGSIRVQVGERVQPGQVLAAVGYTGSTAGPHLHFHLADGPAPLGAEGLPFVLDRFEVIGSYGASDVLSGDPWRSPEPGRGGVRVGELPAPNTVVVFGSLEH